MVTEDYVSFETAKLLKEKGFNCDKQSISAMYNENGEFFSLLTTSELGGYDYEDFDDKDFIAPTLQMAMKWLRKEYNIHIEPRYYSIPNIYRYIIIHSPATIDNISSHPQCFNTNEQACESAINYCLENLI
jgi:hypothetical protein